MGCAKSKSVEEINQTEPNPLIKSAENLPLKEKLSVLDKKEKGNALLFSYNQQSSYNKSIYRKTKNTLKNSPIKNKKDPYIITSIDSDYGQITIVKLNACSFLTEYLIPIWFEKNTFIKFITTGKWRIDKSYEYTDSAGMPSSHSMNFNYGAAVARVGSGPSFLLSPNEFTYYTNFEGPLYLKMNLPKKIKVSPEGTIEVKVFDGTLMSIEEINEKIGWKEKDMKYENKNSTEIENELTVNLNNLRMNPILFYEKNITNNKNKIWTENFLKQMKQNNDNNGIIPFSINNNCFLFLHNYIELNYENIKKNIGKRDANKFLKELGEKISFNIKDEFACENFVNCRIVKKNKIRTSDICLEYLFDKNFRKNIFIKEYNSIAINITDEFLDDSYFIILAIMKGVNNGEEEDICNM